MSAATLLAPAPGPMTTEEFLQWNPGDGRMWQLVEGKPQAMAPTTRTHSAIQSELSRLIGNHLHAHRPGCSVLSAPGIIPRVLGRTNVRIPDLAVSCSPYVNEEATLNGAVLVIEILSPSNVDETWYNIWAYITLPSVIEVLVVHSTKVGALVIRRSPDLSWPHFFTEITDGDLILDSIGFQTPLQDLYQTTRLST